MATSTDCLDILGVSPAAARLIRYFLIRPNARPHLRAIQRQLGLGGASVQRELDRLVLLGALLREQEARAIQYRVADQSPVWTAMRLLESAAVDPVPLLRDALVDVSGVTTALLFGSMAAGRGQAHSDIDVFVLEEAQAVEKARLYRNLAEVGLILGREVNVVRYTASALAGRLGDSTQAGWGFVRQVLTAPKKLLAGSKEPLELLASAAGINGDALDWAAA